MASQIASKLFKSHSSSSAVLSIPAVLTITLILVGIFISLKEARARSRSSPTILLDIPPDLALFGLSTIKRPARLTKVVSAAPFLPRSSLSIWMTISCPSLRTSLILTREPGSIFLIKYSLEISFNGKKP